MAYRPFAAGCAIRGVVCELFSAHEGGKLARQDGCAAQKLRGVERDSVCATPELPVLSFELDPGLQSPQTAVGGLRLQLQRQGITPTLLKVLRAQPVQKRNGT